MGTGAVYAALALGLVLVHRASGVVNFAHGALASVAAYAHVALAGLGLPLVASIPATLAASAALGGSLHAVVFRRLDRAPVLSRVVATVGVMLTAQAAIVLWFGTDSRPVGAILPTGRVELAGSVIPLDRLLLALVVVVAALALAATLRWTRFGLASRAATDSPAAAALSGWSPGALTGATWALAGALAAGAGVLAAPITGLTPATYTLLVVPALAAALAGGLRSFAVTTAAAFALGMGQSLVAGIQADAGWLPRVGLRDGLAPLVVLLALAFRGRALRQGASRRGAGGPRGRLPAVGSAAFSWRSATLGAAAGAAVLVALALGGGRMRLALITSGIVAVLCLSVVVVTGYLGRISLAQMTFAGVAGFSLARLGVDAGVPFPLAPLVAALLAALAGLVLAAATRRAGGMAVAVATLAAAVAVDELVFKNPAITAGFGSLPVPGLAVGPLDLSIGGPAAEAYPRAGFGVLVVAVVVLACAGVVALRRSAPGRRLLAVRRQEHAAAASGVDVGRTRMAGFALSGFVAGVGGCLLAYSEQQVSFASYGVFMSLTVVVLACLGGVGRVAGALVGGALAAGGIAFTLLDQAVGIGSYQLLASGLAVIAVVVAYPDGVAPGVARAATRLVRPASLQAPADPGRANRRGTQT